MATVKPLSKNTIESKVLGHTQPFTINKNIISNQIINKQQQKLHTSQMKNVS